MGDLVPGLVGVGELVVSGLVGVGELVVSGLGVVPGVVPVPDGSQTGGPGMVYGAS